MSNVKNSDFTLFKRSDEREAHFYFKFDYLGKRYTRNLRTNNELEGQRRARIAYKEIVGAVDRHDFPTLQDKKMRNAVVATVAELEKAYHLAPVDAGAESRKMNINAMRQILRVAGGVAEGAEGALPITAINGAAVAKWFETATAKSAAATDQAEQVAMKRSANSRFRQAVSLLIPKAMAAYTRSGCHHASLEEFVKAGELNKFSRLPAIQYNAPNDAIIAATLAAWEAIEDRNLFLTIGHELAFGLRTHEIAQAKWSWWSTRQGYPVIDGSAWVKNNSFLVQVRALDPWFAIMADRIKACGWRGATDDYILVGCDSFRTDSGFRAVSEWMRALGWETIKTNHALRAYSGSQIAMKYGLYEASIWLRHAAVTVTQKNYSHFVHRWKPTNLDSIPARWAAVPQVAEPVLRLVAGGAQ